MVTLSGNVPDEPFRRMAVDCARAALGVVDVRDRLLTDGDLAVRVAAELCHYPELQPSRVRVSIILGTMTREGELEAEEMVRLAGAVVAKVPGVVAIENRLTVREIDNAHPLEAVERRPDVLGAAGAEFIFS